MMLRTLIFKIKQQQKIGIFVLFFFPVLIKLGFWQLSRAQEKQDILAVYQEQTRLPVISLDALPSETSSYYGDVTIIGKYDQSRYWLLDNQPRNGRVGYEVLMPFVSDNGWVLVNRGWLAADQDRTQLPIINTPQERVQLVGYLAQPQQNNIINNDASDLAVEWPKRVIQVNIDTVEASLKTTIFPAIFRLKNGSSGAYTTAWPIVNTQAEKHQAYAVQWFAMALALLTLYSVALIKAPKSKHLDK